MSAPEIIAVCRAATARIAAGDPAGAAGLLAAPLLRHPDDPNLLYVSGNCSLAQGHEAAALEAYRRSVAIAPAFVAALANLGFLLRTGQRIDEARDVLRHAVALEPDNAIAWMNLVSCYVNEGEAAAGEAVAREAVRRHPRNAVIRWNLALLLLEQGKWREGWREFRHRFETPIVTRPQWAMGLRRLEDPAQLGRGETVICHGEQGLGDEILFAGLLAEFVADAGRRGAEVLLAPNPRLASVFARSFAVRQQDPATPGGVVAPDWCVPLGDLPGFYRRDDADFPRRGGFLSVDPAAVARLRAALAGPAAGRPLVGIAWRGGSAYTHAVHRTIPLSDWMPLLSQPACFVSLAYHDAAAEIAAVRADHGVDLLDMPEVTLARDYELTCELVAALDLVVAVPTSVHHAAGAVGTACWLVMDERAAWRECSRTESLPWYPTTHRRFVRPRTEESWRPTLARVAAAFAGADGSREPGGGATPAS